MLLCVGPPAGLHDSAVDTGLLRVWEGRTLRPSALLNFKLSCLEEKSAHVIAPVSSEQTSALMEVRARGRTSRGGAWPTPNSVYFWFLIAYLSLSLRYDLGQLTGFCYTQRGASYLFLVFFFATLNGPFCLVAQISCLNTEWDLYPQKALLFSIQKATDEHHKLGWGEGRQRESKRARRREMLYCIA